MYDSESKRQTKCERNDSLIKHSAARWNIHHKKLFLPLNCIDISDVFSWESHENDCGYVPEVTALYS